MTDNPDVSVVVVNFRTPDLTAEAVESVLHEPEVREVIVVDNASGDQSVEALRERFRGLPVDVLESEENIGFGRGCNLGVERATGSLVLLLNSDALMRPGSLGHLKATLCDDPSLALVAPLVLGPDGYTPQADAYGTFPSLSTLVLRTNRHPRDTVFPDWLSGVALLARRDAFLSVGAFDHGFHMYLEDVDLCRRLRDAGLRVQRVPSAVVLHRGGASQPSTRAQAASYFESQDLYFRRAGASAWQLALLRLLRWPLRVRRMGGWSRRRPLSATRATSRPTKPPAS